MKIIIDYKAIDPNYSDQRQVFIGQDRESIDDQIYEFEEDLGREHPFGFSTIYRKEEQL